ncbi:MAG: amidohydrolase [Chloroflexi bacterium]|nr:MAG: amidohydrolase [Chloroflexota bacterium]
MHESQSYDLLITGGKIATMDDQHRIIDGGSIAISGNTIQKIYAPANFPKEIKASRVINANNKVIIPGLINAHSHIAMTLFRGFVEDLALHKWLEKVWKYELSALDENSIRVGSKLAFAEMIRSGVTCVHDMYWHYMATIDLAEEVGFRLLSGPSFTSIGNPDFDETISNTRKALDQIMGYRFVEPIIQAHSTYTTNPEMMHKVREFKQAYGVTFTTHASENQAEVNDVRKQYGKTPIELLQSYDLLDDRTILAHCVKVQDHEIAMLSKSKTNVVHCPECNLKLGSGIAPIASMMEAGINVCIGTDGAASNNDLDLWGEVRTAALLQKGITENPEALTTRQAMEMATTNGAKAYGLDQKLGSLEEGKRADLVIIDFDKSHLTPCHDVYAHLVYSVNKADVDSVVIDGVIHLDGGELTTLDEDAIKAEARQIGEKFV